MKEFPQEFESKKTFKVYPEGSGGREADILEIGPGRGDLLFSMAERYPDKEFIAIEIGNKRYNKLVANIDKLGLTNVAVIYGNARIAMPKYYNAQSFEKIYVLFPDPWPKGRQALKRLLSREFLTFVSDYLKTDGDLFMATDVDWYADWVVDNCRDISQLKNQGEPFVQGDSIFGYEPTFFEQKWKGMGKDIYYMHYKKTEC